MTHQHIRRRPFQRLGNGDLCFGILTLFCLFLILKNSDIAIEYIHNGLTLCAKTVIPSLFPFMVISELIVGSGIAEPLLRPFSPLFKRLFSLSPTGTSCVLLGMLCGFPIGAKCAMRALAENRITKDEAERIVAISSGPSSAFLISAVGLSLWGNKRFGGALYLCVLLSELITGFFLARIKKREADNVPSPISDHYHTVKKSPAALFTEAIRSSCNGMLLVCAYVIFFAALVGALGNFVSALSIPPFFSVFLFGFFELSGGMSHAAAMAPPLAAALISAFFAGWSGVSVHCQMLSVCEGHGLSLDRYFLSKLAQALLTLLLIWIAVSLMPELLSSARQTDSVPALALQPIPPMTVVFLVFLLFFPKSARK